MYSVLYVDNETGLLEIGKIFLERGEQFSVDTAVSAPDALSLIRAKNYDAIVSDYQMPDMDGITFLTEVRTGFGTIPFILFTGKGREEVVIEALNRGADFYLQKGGDMKSQYAELAHTIKKAVDGRRQQEALRKSEIRFRSIIQNSDDIIIVVNREGTITYSSPAAGKILGYSEHGLLGKNPLDLVHPDDRDRIRQTLAGLSNKNSLPRLHEYRAKKADGSYVYLESIGSNLLDLPEINGLVITSRDITKRRAAEEALKKSEVRFRSIIQNSNDFIIVVNRKGTVVYSSPAYGKMAGYPEGSLTGRDPLEIVHPDDLERVKEALVQSFDKDHIRSPIEYRARKADGSYMDVESVSSYLLDVPEVNGIVITTRDITDRKRAEQAAADNGRK
jgi:PAS domain S-box-containing protein